MGSGPAEQIPQDGCEGGLYLSEGTTYYTASSVWKLRSASGHVAVEGFLKGLLEEHHVYTPNNTETPVEWCISGTGSR